MSEHDGTPAHLQQLDAAEVAAVVAKLRTIELGYGAKMEIDAFAETRTIHDGRRLFNLLQYAATPPNMPEFAATISSASDDLWVMLAMVDLVVMVNDG